ncbi:MAG: lactate racemase domain-containing protein [Candidatus Aerophobetes bacterium]|nr:lactate racemase domain-containing protein [Candidatus Aerophobetes bacterium]
MSKKNFPRMVKIRQKFEAPAVKDVKNELSKEVAKSKLKERIKPGDKVAITAGSRGISHIAEITAAVVKEVKGLGGEPFIVPAMGSHGGATAEGQIAVLKSYGITESFIGAPIRSSMEVVKIGKIREDVPVLMDKIAFNSDAIIVVNRVKLHTSFRGEVESGLMKMLSIGLGKHAGAILVHSFGSRGLREMVPQAARVMLKEANVVLGIAILENAYEETAKIASVEPEDFEKVEPGLLKESRELMPSLPFDELDLLIVDEIGKNISGTGMDTNIIGRLMIRGEKEFEKPQIDKIVALDVTPESHGNAQGMGLADITVKRLVDKIDYKATYANVLTSGFLNRANIPPTFGTDKEAIATALETFRRIDPAKARVVRIKNTLLLEKVYISEVLLKEAKEREDIVIIGEINEMTFDSKGNLMGGDYV